MFSQIVNSIIHVEILRSLLADEGTETFFSSNFLPCKLSSWSQAESGPG